MRPSIRRNSVLLLLATAAGCSSLPAPKMLVPTANLSAHQVKSLGTASGSVVDILTVSGQEKYVLLGSVTDRAMTGQLFDRDSGAVPDDSVTIPLSEAALLYYVEPADPSHKTHAAASRRAIPAKYSYPQLPSVGSAEKKLSCADLDVELSRAEALRWFARNEGQMGYTPAQVLAHHAATTAIVVGVTLVIVAAAGGGGAAGGSFPNFSGAQPPRDPTGNLRSQVGDGALRWAITAADVRVAGLLRLKRDGACPERSTLVDGASDLHTLQQLDALQDRSPAPRLSGIALLHEQTRLLDTLGPRALADGRLADCGAFHCDNSGDQGDTSGVVMVTVQLMPELAQEHVQHVFSHALWFGETQSSFARAMSQAEKKSPAGALIVFDQSLVFSGTAAGGPRAQTDPAPPLRIRIPFTDIASVEAGSSALNRWVAVHTRDGQTHFFALLQQSGNLDRSQTRMAAALLQSDLSAAGR